MVINVMAEADALRVERRRLALAWVWAHIAVLAQAAGVLMVVCGVAVVIGAAVAPVYGIASGVILAGGVLAAGGTLREAGRF